MFTYLFWQQTLERAFKTFAQTLVALFSAGGIGLLNAPWTTALSAAGMATLLSVLTSMASEPWGTRNSPSLTQSAPAAAAQPASIPAPAPTTASEPIAVPPAPTAEQPAAASAPV